jgi:hypothetical protein
VIAAPLEAVKAYLQLLSYSIGDSAGR